MANVTESGIATPDEDDDLDPEVWSAAMAASIENGIGKRVKRQEVSIGLKAGIAGGTTVAYQDNLIAPYEILPGEQCFAQGMTLDSGIVTLSVDGLYFVSASASLEATQTAPDNTDRTIALQIYKGGVQLVGCEVGAATHWSTAQANCTFHGIAGDTIYVKWYSSGPTPGQGQGTLSSNTPMNSLSIVLVTPVGTADL